MSEGGPGERAGGRRVLVGMLVALGFALLAALLVIAFLLGRLSVTAERAAPIESRAATPSRNGIGELPSLAPEGGVAAGLTTADPQSSAPPAPLPESQGPAPLANTLIPQDAGTPDRARIAAYFHEVDRLEDMGAGDPQAFARSLMETVTSGDFTGFDALIAKARAQRDRLRAMVPPPACAEHHRLAIALAADSVDLMERLKSGLMKGDSAGLLAMSTEGQALETRAGEIRSLAAKILRQAGL